MIFAKNEVVVCIESNMGLPENTDLRYEENNGQLIYAFIRAVDMADAVIKAKQLIPATDYIMPPSGDPSLRA